LSDNTQTPRALPNFASGAAPVTKNPRTWKIRLRSVSHKVTWFLGNRFPETFPLVFVVGYPKTGTTWACQLVADYLQIPFPRYPLLPIGFEAAVHGHELVRRSYRRGVYVMRDGRDALVSQYFFVARFIPEGDNPPVPRAFRHMFKGIKNKADVARNLPVFLEQALSRPITSRPWHDHVRSFYEVNNPGVVMLRYEELIDNGAPTLAEAMGRLTGEPPDLERAAQSLGRYAFEALAKRKNSSRAPAFLRKGRSGDWVNHFTRESADIFDRYTGDALIQTGYEKDRSWLRSVPQQLPPPQPRAPENAHAPEPAGQPAR
jgi:hypothetical protein